MRLFTMIPLKYLRILKTPSSKVKTLVVITGPTAVGKTQTSIDIARALNADILSADARQFYRELVIGTAAPSPEEQAQVAHHLVGNLSVFDYYNVSIYEQEALQLLQKLFQKSDYAVLTGGSGLYIDALCQGIDDLPDADPEIRNRVNQLFLDQGLPGLRFQLQNLDPEFYAQVDLANPKRMMRAIEVCWATGSKYSDLRSRPNKARPFRIVKIILDRPRHELFDRINQRTCQMVQQGIIEEALKYFPLRHLNALNTVGYKELFAWLGGNWDLATAIEKIQTNTRRYAKRQLTWFRRYEDAHWFHPQDLEGILNCIRKWAAHES